jgi:hypothetical protein
MKKLNGQPDGCQVWLYCSLMPEKSQSGRDTGSGDTTVRRRNCQSIN